MGKTKYEQKRKLLGQRSGRSFFKSLKVEWVYKHDYGRRSEAELSIFQWIETWYNRRRIHSTLGYKTIGEFETEMSNQKVAA